MLDSEYDQRYLELCNEFNRFRMILDFYASTLSNDADKMYGQMNMFWGAFKNVLYLTARGETVA